MTKATSSWLALVILIASAHALCHLYELAFPSVSVQVASQFELDKFGVGTLASCWALPFGFGAVLAGWLADRFGCRQLLLVFMVTAGATSLGIGLITNLPSLVLLLVLSGTTGSLYHPAGLAYLSRTLPRSRLPLALGYHGIAGSLGIAAGPLIAQWVMPTSGWQAVFLVLAPVGPILAIVCWFYLPHEQHLDQSNDQPQEKSRWVAFGSLCAILLVLGLVYRGFLTFLPSQLDTLLQQETAGGGRPQGMVAAILLCGAIGQYCGGLLATRYRQDWLQFVGLSLSTLLLGSFPWLDTNGKLIVITLFTVIHFALQPISNSLIATYTPRHRRSLGYGLSFMVNFGLGGFGSMLVGAVADANGSGSIFPTLAALCLVGTIVAGGLNGRFDSKALVGRKDQDRTPARSPPLPHVDSESN